MASGIHAKAIACLVTALFTAIGIGPTAQADPILDDCYIIQEGRPDKLLCITLDLEGTIIPVVSAPATAPGADALYFGVVELRIGAYTATTYSAGLQSACPAFAFGAAIQCSVISQSPVRTAQSGPELDVLCLQNGEFYFAPDSSGNPPTLRGPITVPVPCPS